MVPSWSRPPCSSGSAESPTPGSPCIGSPSRSSIGAPLRSASGRSSIGAAFLRRSGGSVRWRSRVRRLLACGSVADGVAPSVGAAAWSFPGAPPSSSWKRNSLSSACLASCVCICVSWNSSPSTRPVRVRTSCSRSWMRTSSCARVLLVLRHEDTLLADGAGRHGGGRAAEQVAGRERRAGKPRSNDGGKDGGPDRCTAHAEEFHVRWLRWVQS